MRKKSDKRLGKQTQATTTRKWLSFILFVFVLLLSTVFLSYTMMSDKDNYQRIVDSNQILSLSNDAEYDLPITETMHDVDSHIPVLREGSENYTAKEDNMTDLPLPEAISDLEMATLLAKMNIKQIWQKQDEIMFSWPTYYSVRDSLMQDLKQELSDNITEEELVRLALSYREGYWKSGGGFSRISYKHIYKSRILLELAHSHSPDNMEIIDELVETIQASQPLFVIQEGKPKLLEQHHDNQKVLLALRSEQFDRIKRETADGRVMTWKNFVCICDLITLLSRNKQMDIAKEVLDWQLQYTGHGDFEFYESRLKKWRAALDKGQGYAFNIYLPTMAKWPDESRYFRRLPSFLGPKPQERGVVPLNKVTASSGKSVITIESKSE